MVARLTAEQQNTLYTHYRRPVDHQRQAVCAHSMDTGRGMQSATSPQQCCAKTPTLVERYTEIHHDTRRALRVVLIS